MTLMDLNDEHHISTQTQDEVLATLFFNKNNVQSYAFNAVMSNKTIFTVNFTWVCISQYVLNAHYAQGSLMQYI